MRIHPRSKLRGILGRYGINPSRTQFRRVIKAYYRTHGRDLAWRHTRDPYKILVSEVMLQQTQVERVRTKYPEFIARFPNFRALAAASLSDVLAAWQGMGYNRRALALKRLAEIVMREHGGVLSKDPKVLDSLPGIGWATACAIMAFAYQRPFPFIETNIRRVFIHFFFSRKRKISDAKILALVASTLDTRNSREWYYALMDYGSYLARIVPNPNRRASQYRRQTRFEGSERQLRGRILTFLTRRGAAVRIGTLARIFGGSHSRIKKVLDDLAKEGFIIIRSNRISLPI